MGREDRLYFMSVNASKFHPDHTQSTLEVASGAAGMGDQVKIKNKLIIHLK